MWLRREEQSSRPAHLKIMPPEMEAPGSPGDLKEDRMEAMPSSIEAPLESIGGAKVGDTVSMKVESIDEQSGMATLVPAGQPQSQSQSGSSIERASEEFAD